MSNLPDITSNNFIDNKFDLKTQNIFKMLLDISELANINSKKIIVNGGFAVDIAVGKITRPHDDLDLVVFINDLEFFKKLFIDNDFKIGIHGFEGNKYGFTIEKNGLTADIDSIGTEGNNVFDIDGPQEEKWIWPIKYSELIWQRKIDNTIVEFFSPTLIYDFKKRRPSRPKENHDFQVLEDAFPYLTNYQPK